MALANVPFLYPLKKHFLTMLTGKKYVLLNSVYKQPPEVFYKEGGLTNFVELTGKLLYYSLFFNKVSGLWPATLFKK